MSPVPVQVDRHVGLCPSPFLSQPLDALSQPDQKGMIAAGHVSMVGILLPARVWHTRQNRELTLSSVLPLTESLDAGQHRPNDRGTCRDDGWPGVASSR